MGNYIGQQFGNYRLVKLLGEGGFAEVYLGEHIHLDTQAAVKVLTTKLTSEGVHHFREEARIIIGLEHPNIVRVYDFGIQDQIPYIVMGYAPMGSLRRLHPRGTPLSLNEIVPYVLQIAAALQYAHERKLIHRDVKPDNMLLGQNNAVLLSDFGVAVVAHSSHSLNIQDKSGTLYYMAPEQIQGKPRYASDQYALGIVTYEWLSGKPPFTGNAAEIGMKHLLTPPPPLHEQISSIPQDVEQVVLKALDKDPKQRFENVQAFAIALEQASQTLQSTSTIVLADQVPVLNNEVDPPNQFGMSSVLTNLIHTSHPLELASVEEVTIYAPDQPTKSTDSLNTLNQLSSPAGNETIIFQQGETPDAPYTPSSTKQLLNSSDLINLQDIPKPQFPPSESLITRQLLGRGHVDTIPQGAATVHSKSKPSLQAILSISIILLVLANSVVAYLAFQTLAATSVSIDFSPLAHTINQIYTIRVDPTIQNADINTQSIPARPLSSSEQSSMTGPTTGHVNCTFGFFQCQQGVSQGDVDSLVSQIQPKLEQAITRELKNKIISVNGKALSSSNFQILSITSNPAVGEAGKAVTVTIQEQGSIGYFLTNDAEHLAQQLLTRQAQQYGLDYVLLPSSITTGPPVIEEVASGLIDIKIAAGCIVQYQFPQSELQAIRNGLKGRTLKDAGVYLTNQPGVDSGSIIIHFIKGKSDTLPGDAQQIQLKIIYPESLAPVQLHSVPTATFTP